MIINTLDTCGSIITVELNVFGNVFSGISIELELTERLSMQDVKKVKLPLAQACNCQFVYLIKDEVTNELRCSLLSEFDIIEDIANDFAVSTVDLLDSTSYTPTMSDK